MKILRKVLEGKFETPFLSKIIEWDKSWSSCVWHQRGDLAVFTFKGPGVYLFGDRARARDSFLVITQDRQVIELKNKDSARERFLHILSGKAGAQAGTALKRTLKKATELDMFCQAEYHRELALLKAQTLIAEALNETGISYEALSEKIKTPVQEILSDHDLTVKELGVILFHLGFQVEFSVSRTPGSQNRYINEHKKPTTRGGTN